jgi:hypothetical protein
MIKSKYPNLNFLISFDHLMLEEFAREYMKAHKMSNDAKLLFGHIIESEFPECDVIIASYILQFFYQYDKKEILLKMFKSIRREGYLIILKNLTYDPEYLTKTPAKKASLLYTLEGYQNYNCTFDEIKETLEDTGFKQVEHVKKKGFSD